LSYCTIKVCWRDKTIDIFLILCDIMFPWCLFCHEPISRWQKQWNPPFMNVLCHQQESFIQGCRTAKIVQLTNIFICNFVNFPLILCLCHQQVCFIQDKRTARIVQVTNAFICGFVTFPLFLCLCHHVTTTIFDTYQV